MMRSALGALLGLLVLPGVVSAAPLPRLTDAGRARLLISDGDRYLVVSRTINTDRALPGQLIVRDLRRGTRRTLAPLPGCRPQQARRGQLTWDCPDLTQPGPRPTHGFVEDLRTGQRAPLPAVDPRPDLEYAEYLAAGRRWLLVHRQGYHYEDWVLIDRSTGAQLPSGLVAPSRQRVVDLDADSGEATLCPGQQAPLVDRYGPTSETTRGPLDRDGTRAATTTYLGDDPSGPLAMVYQRCGRPQRVLHRCATQGARCGTAQIDGRWVAWAWEAPVRAPYFTEVVLYDSRSRKRLVLPRATDVELLGGRVAVLRHGHLFLGRLP